MVSVIVKRGVVSAIPTDGPERLLFSSRSVWRSCAGPVKSWPPRVDRHRPRCTQNPGRRTATDRAHVGAPGVVALGWQAGSAHRILEGGAPSISISCGGRDGRRRIDLSWRRGRYRGHAHGERVARVSIWASLKGWSASMLERSTPARRSSMSAPADRFDGSAASGSRGLPTFIFQKRRAEMLARQIRDRVGELTDARVDPAGLINVIHPL